MERTRHVIPEGGKRERSDLCNKRGSTRRGRTTVSSKASAPRSPVCVAIPEGRRERRVASSRRAIVNLGSRFVCEPPTPMRPPPSHRSCYVPGQVRGAAPPGQPAIILVSFTLLVSLSSPRCSYSLYRTYVLLFRPNLWFSIDSTRIDQVESKLSKVRVCHANSGT